VSYAHHYAVKETLDPEAFEAFRKDVAKLLRAARELDLRICGPTGTGAPTVAKKTVSFNGERFCGHPARKLGIPWPAADARGITTAYETRPERPDPTNATVGSAVLGYPQPLANDADVAGIWPGGVLLKGRTCDGCCAAEAFTLRQSYKGVTTVHKENGWVFDGCATNFRPFDVIVTASLLLARHHFKHDIRVETNGLPAHWLEGYALVRSLFPQYDLGGVQFAGRNEYA